MSNPTWSSLHQGLPQPDLTEEERYAAPRNQIRVNANLWAHVHELEAKAASYDRIRKIIEEGNRQ